MFDVKAYAMDKEWTVNQTIRHLIKRGLICK